MSTPAGFFDILYLGVFITVSPVLDVRFYDMSKYSATLVAEVEHAVCHFQSLLHIFSQHFIIILEGEPIAPSYVVDCMVAEFAAAVAVLAQSIVASSDENSPGMPGGVYERLRSIVLMGYPTVFQYFVQCVD